MINDEQTPAPTTSAKSTRTGLASIASAPDPEGRLPSHDEDFGTNIERRNLSEKRIGQFRVVGSLEMYIYENEDGFTARAYPFTQIIGYGATPDEAYQDAIAQLLHSRNFYDRLADGRGTAGAQRQRALIKQYLVMP
jgi:hypothetical protein